MGVPKGLPGSNPPGTPSGEPVKCFNCPRCTMRGGSYGGGVDIGGCAGIGIVLMIAFREKLSNLPEEERKKVSAERKAKRGPVPKTDIGH